MMTKVPGVFLNNPQTNKQTNKTRGCAAVAKVVQPKKMP